LDLDKAKIESQELDSAYNAPITKSVTNRGFHGETMLCCEKPVFTEDEKSKTQKLMGGRVRKY
jgi:hypothetical protein